MRQHFLVIGIDDNVDQFLPPHVLRAIAQGHVFSGGMRHRELVGHLLPAGAEWVDITVPLSAVLVRYAELFAQGTESIIVFASGDPLFFGFATTLQREMPQAKLTVFPTFNSLQTLAHRLLLRYDDMRLVSLTGRPWPALDQALIERAPKIGVLTDRTHTPATIAQRLLDYGFSYYNIYVGEHLGHPAQERVRRLSLEEAARSEFAQPNCLILEAQGPVPPRPFGIPESDFELLDGRAKMITKMPIRLLSLQAMELPRRTVMWDVGFCTGSVSIEARLQFPHLRIIAFEVRPQGEALMRTNSRRFGAPGIETLIGDFLAQDLTSLPRPDAVFIGGHGGRLAEMMQRIVPHLLPGGCVVMNSVSEASRQLFLEAAQATGLLLQPEHHIALDDNNPIIILKATKQ